MTHKQKVQYAIYAAEQVIGLYEKRYPTDDRPRRAIEAARECLNNPNINNKRAAAYAAYAAYAAHAAAHAAHAAAYAAAYAAHDMKQKIINYGISLLEEINER